MELPSTPETPSQETSGGKSVNTSPAVEVGSTAMRILQLAKTSHGLEIVKIAYRPLDPEGLTPTTTIQDSLKKLIEDYKITGPVVASLPLSKIQVLSFVLPHMPEGEIEQATTWKLKSNLPQGQTFRGITFDYVPCVFPQRRLNHKEIRVLVFVASKPIVMEHIKLFQDCSLKLIAVEPKPYAILKALMWFGRIREEEIVLVLYLGASQSSVTIVYHGYPFLMQPLSISGRGLTQVIANYHRFDLKKAEEIKKQEGSAKSICWPAISSQVENLVFDIEHTLRSFSHLMGSPSLTFHRILLAGGSSDLPHLATFLADRLSVPVEVFNPLNGAGLSGSTGSPPRFKQELAPLVKENAVSFCSVLGLAAGSIDDKT